MELSHSAALAVLQGLTEFLPISSSAHLILLPYFAHWPDQGLSFDVILHMGTLMAVIAYFQKDIRDMLTKNHFLVKQLILATIPACIFGYWLGPSIEVWGRSPLLIAYTSIGFGLLLGLSDRFFSKRRTMAQLRMKEALWIGLLQALALIPGTSRSGITMTAGRMLGLNRESAARFSFLLSIPTISLGAMLGIKNLLSNSTQNPAQSIEWGAIGLGLILSAITGYLSIHWFLKLLQKVGFWPFVIYRVLLGSVILYYC